MLHSAWSAPDKERGSSVPRRDVCLWDVCLRDVCLRDVCLRDVCLWDVCARDVCARDVCVPALAGQSGAVKGDSLFCRVRPFR